MPELGYIAIFLFTALVGAVGAWVILRRTFVDKSEETLKNADEILSRVNKETKKILETAELEARQESLDRRNEAEEESEDAEAEMAKSELKLASLEERLGVWEKDLDDWSAEVNKRLNDISSLKGQAKKRKKDAQEMRESSISLVEERAGEKAEELKKRITDGLIEDHRADAADRLRNIDVEVGPEAPRLAKRILGISVGRFLPEPTPPRVSSTLSLSPKDAELFRKDGATLFEELEAHTGAHVAFDETERTLRVESPDGVLRELGRRVLKKFINGKRGGIPKGRAQGVIRAVDKEIQKEIRSRGRKAFKLMRLDFAADEIVNLIGRLYFRTSYAQNQYHHAVEASILAGLMAAELGVDVKVAQRAGLLHDIGKALTHEIEGSHAVIGAEVAKRNDEPEVVVNAIASHHDDEEPASVYAHLVAASDAASGARPGARRELVEAYMDRIQDLERVARSFNGVSGAYAVQAGRELRVLVDEKATDDTQASSLATSIAEKIAEEMVFPGQIKVTVIRSLNAVAVAS